MSTETGDAETPVEDHNHALAALRYLVSCLDEQNWPGCGGRHHI
jgi:hypothetical protein